MAPTKITRPVVPAVAPRSRGISTRSKATIHTTTVITKDMRGKRKADGSPTKENGIKRSAFGDVTNAITKIKGLEERVKILTKNHGIVKKVTVHQKTLPTLQKPVTQKPLTKTVFKPKQNENLAPPPAPIPKIQTRASTRTSIIPNETAQKPKEATTQKENVAVTKKVKTRLSNEFEKTEESLYSTALEEM